MMKLGLVLLLVSTGATAAPPATVMWDGKLLAQARAHAHTPQLQPAVLNLLGWANHWKTEADHNRTFSVMSKPESGPSGNKHDFYSLATYWWPNKTAPKGLPYVRRDGFVNPETFLYDSVPLSQMIFAVSNLSLGYYFTGRQDYCAAAVQFIDVWFLAVATRMNPASGLQYAQLTRGLDKGRGIGIIDAKDIAFVADSVLLLSPCSAWPPVKQHALAEWFSSYAGWLTSSSHAVDEFNQVNNHGTWFDVQAITLSLHVNNHSYAKFLAHDALRRIKVQIMPNGTMPLELSRTRSMHYTWWNMMAFFELAQAASHLAVDVFCYRTKEGGSLQQALDYVAPYTIQAPDRWPYAEETPFDHGKFFQILRVASIKFNDSRYERLIPKLPGNVNYTTSTINLVWPRQYA